MHNRFITATAAPYTLVVMSNPRATIREVAEAAGVSRATVSYALNGGGRVSAETRARIQAVAVRLNYRPHRTARGLRMGRSRTLGLMLPAPTDGRAHPVSRIDFYLDLALAAATAAFERDHGLLLLPSALAGNLDQVGVDGMLICNPESGDVRIASVEAAGVPVVTIDRDLARPSHQHWVAADTRRSTRLLLDHLVDRGAGGIVLLNGSPRWSWPADTEEAYRDWCATHDHEAKVVTVPLPPDEEATARAVDRLLGTGDPPDAILGLPIAFATTVLRVAEARGVRVPDDLLVAACVDGREAIAAQPGITAVDISPDLQARAAVDMLLSLVDGGSPAAPEVVEPRLCVRASTARSAAP